MRYLSAAIYFAIIISFPGSCKKDAHKTGEEFNYEQAAGIWVPYEITDEFGTIHTGPFTANNFFGSYCESVHLNSDKTFIPGNWENQSFNPRTAEAGSFEYISGHKLRFKGTWEAEWDIIKFEGDELWLKMHPQSGEVLYKFKRQH